MSRTETVTLTNMCMIYDGDKVLVQQKVDDDYSGITFPAATLKKANLLPMPSSAKCLKKPG